MFAITLVHDLDFMDAFFDILKTEDSDAVALFGRWINDYLRQVAEIDLDAPDM